MKRKLLYYINVPYHIANHVVGERHTRMHRRIAGMIVMAIGVFMAHAMQHIGNVLISLLGDLVGFSLHGTGLIPFIHEMETQKETTTENQTTICETC